MHAASQGVEKVIRKGNDQNKTTKETAKGRETCFERAHKYQFRAADEYEVLVREITCTCLSQDHGRQRGRKRVVASSRKVCFPVSLCLVHYSAQNTFNYF